MASPDLRHPESFGDRLDAAAQANDSLLCVGLDPDIAQLPSSLRQVNNIEHTIVAFNSGIIAATSDLVTAYKPNLAFYLAHGQAGVAALEETRRRIPRNIPVVLDAKVGDVGSTAEAYASAYFDTWAFDAVTVNPYLGEDSLEPFMRRADRGVIVVCKTSNRGSGDLQDLAVESPNDPEPLFMTVAGRVAAWAERWPATLGLVVGATYPAELSAVRNRCPNLPILLPGIGAQAGDLAASLRAGLRADQRGLMVSASRSIIYAGNASGEHWADDVRAAAQTLRTEINDIRASRASA
jgi:orotidine-5'-phosphate decarboxylase